MTSRAKEKEEAGEEEEEVGKDKVENEVKEEDDIVDKLGKRVDQVLGLNESTSIEGCPPSSTHHGLDEGDDGDDDDDADAEGEEKRSATHRIKAEATLKVSVATISSTPRVNSNITSRI